MNMNEKKENTEEMIEAAAHSMWIYRNCDYPIVRCHSPMHYAYYVLLLDEF